MKIFISGTDTNVGKTLISSWLALHTGFAYFKPVQTGLKEERDSMTVAHLSRTKIYSEIYAYQEPLSPHLAAKQEGTIIDIDTISLPQEEHLVVEGAGGVLVPLNEQYFMADLIKKLDIPVILVSRSHLGTINHTLLSLESLRSRGIEVLGVIMNGDHNSENKKAIEFYGQTSVLFECPKLPKVTYEVLKNIKIPEQLTQMIGKRNDTV